jgi:hypothetical protein
MLAIFAQLSLAIAPVAELVDALDSKSSSSRSAGSIPARGTNFFYKSYQLLNVTKLPRQFRGLSEVPSQSHSHKAENSSADVPEFAGNSRA